MSAMKTTTATEVLAYEAGDSHKFSAICGSSFLGIEDLSASELRSVLSLAAKVKAEPAAWAGALSGMHAALVFEKPSLRTRVSFEIGLTKLGLHAVYLDQKGSKLGERESLKDFAKNMERFVDLLVARVFNHSALEVISEHASIPIVNALSDAEHPCQALADVLTMSEHLGDGFSGPDGGLEGKRLAWIGDGNNVCHSLMLAAATLGVSQTIITPKGFEPRFEVLRAATERASASGAKIELATDLTAVGAGGGHDAVYTDCWVSMGQDHQGNIREQAFAGFQVDEETMQAASKGPAGSPNGPAIFMHCLPAHRGEEVTDTVIDSDQSVVYDQAENRMHAQNALVLALLGKA